MQTCNMVQHVTEWLHGYYQQAINEQYTWDNILNILKYTKNTLPTFQLVTIYKQGMANSGS